MPAGKVLISFVFEELIKQLKPVYPRQIKIGNNSDRAIRYAIAELVKQGKARRIGNKFGPVEAIRRD